MSLSFVLVLALAASPSTHAHSSAPSPYAGEEGRAIKALSPQEIADTLAGRGMGLAKAAELNGYPGPKHVLELADELALTPDQRERTAALFERMETRAKALGTELVAAERELDQLFATATITAERLAATLEHIGELQTRLRGAHLEAHLEQARILSDEQKAHYVQLRGYHAGGHGHHGHHSRR